MNDAGNAGLRGWNEMALGVVYCQIHCQIHSQIDRQDFAIAEPVLKRGPIAIGPPVEVGAIADGDQTWAFLLLAETLDRDVLLTDWPVPNQAVQNQAVSNQAVPVPGAPI